MLIRHQHLVVANVNKYVSEKPQSKEKLVIFHYLHNQSIHFFANITLNDQLSVINDQLPISY